MTSLTAVTDQVCGIVEKPKPPRAWYIAFGISVTLTGVLFAMLVYLISTGVGVWGNNAPTFWGWPIVNFVFWVGIGHAGTLISAILFLFRQRWRTSINRFAEAMTIFAVMLRAGSSPGIHVGRVWVVFWMFPRALPAWTCGRTSGSPAPLGRVRGGDLLRPSRCSSGIVGHHPRPGHAP